MAEVKKKIFIMGGGPAGLSAGLELLKSNQNVLIAESFKKVGGLSRTVEYKGYFFDIGGHRFFTKVEEVNKLWKEILPNDFLKRPRLSRIYYNNKFFYYPLKPLNALQNIGVIKSVGIFFSYLITRIKYTIKPKEAKSFEEWVTQRFGKRLFNMFFKIYTEKVWGIPTDQISAAWAAQRIKGLSLSKAIKNAFFPNKDSLTSLIEEFEYPKYGVGMMYDKMAEVYKERGGELMLNSKVAKVKINGDKVESVILETENGQVEKFADNFLSSIPLPELVKIMDPKPPAEIIQAANSLRFRAFISVCLILDQEETFPDNWIYIHSPGVDVGRIQNYKQWSPYMVPDKTKSTIGLEYFCFVGDKLWQKTDAEMIELAKKELEQIGLGKAEKVIDGVVIKLEHVYPVYKIGYIEFLQKVIEYIKQFKNLQIIGRGGTFQYNNMDHSILTGLYAARNILGANYDVLGINTEQEYHETKKNN